MCKDRPKQPDELDSWDFLILLGRKIPMIEIVPTDDTQEDVTNTIAISGYKRVASWRNASGGLVFLFEKEINHG